MAKNENVRLIGKIENVRLMARILANAYESFQAPRIALTNEVRDIVRKTLDKISFSEVEKKKDKKSYEKKYTDKNLLKKWSEAFTKELIGKKEHDYMVKVWGIMKEIKLLETKCQKSMQDYISQEPIYIEFLSKIRGIGPVLSTNLIKEFGDCSNYDTSSKLWAHSGYGLIDGIAPKREKGKTITYSPRLRKLGWKIGESLVMQNRAKYKEIYDKVKETQLKRIYPAGELFEKYGKPYTKEDTNLKKLHAHNRAKRKIIKIFLSHFWTASRKLAGLPAEKTYVEGVLKHTRIIEWEEIIKIEEEYQATRKALKLEEKAES